MLTNHFNFTLRQLTRHKAFSAISTIGLISGITVCLFVAQFVWFEWSFERYNVNAERTYRVNLYNTSNGVFENISAGTVSGLAYAMTQTLPGIESTGRVSSRTKGVVTNRERKVENMEDGIVYADPSIISILGMTLINGDNISVLKDPQSILISETVALKYFGGTNAVGNVLEIGFNGATIEVKPYEVQGVFSDIPANSHQHFDFILPPQNEQAWNENWSWSNVTTYVVLQKSSAPQNLTEGLAKIVKQHHQDDTGDRYILEPITDIRLFALDGSGRSTIVNLAIVLSGAILLLAWFNYVSLSTARFLERMKEVGIRKLVGASRKQLIMQLLTESFVFNFLSFSFALLLFITFWPWLANYIQMPATKTFLQESWAIIIIPAVLIFGTLSSGFYPSFFLSSFKPLQSVKGKISQLADRSTLRKTLVIVQLSITVILTTSIVAINRQISFMQDQDLGISLEQTLVIEEPLLTDGTTRQKFEPFKNEILTLPAVTGVTYASSFPGAEIDWHRVDITLGKENADYRYNSRIISIGTEFLDVFSLPLITGRNFNPDLESDMKTMLINEEACRMFGFKNKDEALNKIIYIGNRKFDVIGVVKNYHFRSLQHPLQPILYIQGYPRNPRYAIKIGTKNIAETISSIEARWKKAYPGNIFSYHFLDEQFEKQYASEKQMGVILAGLTLLAIIISFLGLFGLSLYSVNRRTKEIGIRKVMGASVTKVVVLLSQDFVKLVLAGSIIGVPVIYQGLKVWLQRYAYQMSIDIWLFIWPVSIVIVLTLVTISFQTLKAARINPVDSLKHE